MQVEILIALIGGICGIAGAVVSAVYSRRLAAIQSELDEQRDVRKARRDYEYEARKRLYATYEPIKFQLVDLIGQALRRISALSLIAPEMGSREQAATVYELLAPAALVRMLDRNLTLADMHLEPQVSVEYGLMKAAYRVLTDTSSLASLCSGLPGGAHDFGHVEALLPYELDEAADALLRITPADTSSGVAAGRPGGLLTFSQFSSAFTELSTEGSGLASMTALLAEFTPERRPAFWRAIVTQVLLYGCFLHLVLRGPVTRGGNLPDLAAALLPQLEHAVDAGLRLDKFWMSDEQPVETEVNRKAIRDALPCAALYYRLRVMPALDLGSLEPPR